MTNIAERKNVLIYHLIAGAAGANWYEQIHIDFIPDEVIVRSIAYRFDGTEDSVAWIRTDLVKDNFLGSIIDNQIQNPQQHFTLNKQVNGSYNFQILDDNEDIDDRKGSIHISLEFVKYK